MNKFTTLCLAVLVMAPVNIHADTLDHLLGLSLEELSQVPVTTGSRGEQRSAFLSTAPIKVITSEELNRTGFGETARALQRLLPSMNLSHVSVSDGDDHVRSFSLRGLSVDQVLVLVNGKRLHHSALLHPFDHIGSGRTGVDLNTIPLTAIKHIEILQDGAAAQYGSDAIAGIINIILKDQIEHKVALTIGETKEGDGNNTRMEFATGIESDSSTSFLSVTGELRNRADTNRTGVDTRTYFFDGDPRNDDPELNNLRNSMSGDPDSQDLFLTYNSRLKLQDDIYFYSFGNLNYRETQSPGFYRLPKDSRNVRAIYPDGFLPFIASDLKDLTLTLGFDGSVREWGWDFSNNFGQNEFAVNVENSLNTSLGTASPTEFDAGTLSTFQYLANLDLYRQIYAGWRHPLSVAIGFELRWERYEIKAGEPSSYENGGVPILDGPDAGNLASVGSQVFPGFTPANATNQSRYNFASYIDLEKNLTERLAGQLALRYEYYDDFGSTFNGKLASRFKLTDSIVVRGATSTGFRAPSLGQSHFTSTFTDVFGDGLLEVSHLPVTSTVAQSLGAAPLEPEESVHANIGVGANLSRHYYVSVDLFWAKIKNVIARSGSIFQDADVFGQQVEDILQEANHAAVVFQNNAIDSKLCGLDLEFMAEWMLQSDRLLSFSAAYHYNDVQLDGDVNIPSVLGPESVEAIFGRSQIGRLEDYQQKDNLILSSSYHARNYSLHLRFVRFGETESIPSTVEPEFDQTYDAHWVADLRFEYNAFDALDLALGVNNLFDEYPDYSTSQADSLALGVEQLQGPNGIYRYQVNSPFGYNGASYYLTAEYNF